MLFQMQRRTGETRAQKSLTESPDVIHEMADQERPPDDEGNNCSQHGAHSMRLIGAWPAPKDPIGRQQSQSDGNEVLFEVEQPERRPMPVALQCGPDLDTEIQI